MMRNHSRRALRLISLCGLACIVLASAAQAQDFPDGKGKDMVQSACVECHGLRQVARSKLTPEEWSDVVNDMIGRGAKLMEDEIPVVVEYLSKNFPKAKGEEKFNVNKATAKDIQDFLKLSAEEAAAVVKHRDENGYFHDWDGLAKVPGLDGKKLEPVKDRLTY